jgi:hypothetical protein
MGSWSHSTRLTPAGPYPLQLPERQEQSAAVRALKGAPRSALRHGVAMEVLEPEERALVFVYCSGHVVARCPVCDVSFRYMELAADILGGIRTNMCPRCRQDLTEAVRAHPLRDAALGNTTQAQGLREAAQRLVKETHQLRDRSDVLIREAEAAMFEQQRAVREAMSKRTAS